MLRDFAKSLARIRFLIYKEAMNTFAKISLVVALIAIFTCRASLSAPPTLNAVAVAQLAQKDLEDRGLQDKYFIYEIAYKGKIGTPAWEVLWNKRFPSATSEGYFEIGLRVKMDGSYVRLVKK